MDADSDAPLINMAHALASSQSQDNFKNTIIFVTVLRRLWNYIVFEDNIVPDHLPQAVVSFLLLALKPILEATIQYLWTVLRLNISSWSGPLSELEVDHLLCQYGHSYSLGAEMLYPPHRRCIMCPGEKLRNPVFAACRIYTLHRGVLPAYEVSLYCRQCKTRYHYAYSVSNASESNALRYYYSQGAMPYIHAQESSFLEATLCEFFERTIAISHTSTTDLASMYNETLGHPLQAVDTPLLPTLAQSTIMDAFFMHALLRRASRYNETLTLLHNVPQEHHFDTALEHYNRLMAGTGQPHYSHACLDCLKFFRDKSGNLKSIRAGTTDGVTIGHPCCSKWKCQNKLTSTRDHFCDVHRDCLSQCRILDCEQAAETDFITCIIPAHRAEEEKMRERSEAAFLDLSRRLDKSNVPRTPHRKRKGGKSKKKKEAQEPPALRLQTTRTFTHNEQLFILCCGIIVARSTFFAAEGPSSVKVFLKKIFPERWLLPTHIFYDNACNLSKHLNAQGDTFFKLVRLVVDVFHARKGHNDDFCNENCVPIIFPELRTTRDGKEAWTFNSSIAEQTNVWFGAFQAIVHEMSVSRYNFFLDEMISIRNAQLVGKLERKGKQPFLQSLEAVKEEWIKMHPGESIV